METRLVWFCLPPFFFRTNLLAFCQDSVKTEPNIFTEAVKCAKKCAIEEISEEGVQGGWIRIFL